MTRRVVVGDVNAMIRPVASSPSISVRPPVSWSAVTTTSVLAVRIGEFQRLGDRKIELSVSMTEPGRQREWPA